jgi:hypothetical protein
VRVKDVDFARHQIMVRGGKGDKDRATPRPAVVIADLAKHLENVKRQHDADLRCGMGRAAVGSGPQVPQRRPRVGLAMGVPRHTHLR